MYREALTEIATKAGEEILQIKKDGYAIKNKPDSSPVTEADKRAGEIISSNLKALCPDIPVVSEEDVLPEIGSRFWLVDPLDGTKEFVNGLSDFTVNIALIENGQPIAGVVYLPETGTCFFGDAGGAFKVVNGSIMAIGVSATNSKLRVVASRSHLDEQTKLFIQDLGDSELVRAGSSMKFCLVAEGNADVYPRFGRTMEWDTAAGQAVLEASGGKVLVADSGEHLTYGKYGFENPGFIAVSGPDILSEKYKG